MNKLLGLKPSESITILYLLIVGVLIVIFRRNLARWYVYIVVHAAVILGIFALRFVPTTLPLGFQFLRDWYPLATIPLFYWEIAPITQIVFQGYFDEQIMEWEEQAFSGQPSVDLSARFPSLLLSEFLHFCYFSYYLIIVGLAASLYIQSKYEAFHQTVFAQVFTFDVCLICYIFLPVTGPRYGLDKISSRLSKGFFFNLVHAIVSNASSKGTAFPSSHCSISVIVMLCAARYDLLSFYILFPLCTGLVISTVYGRFHYALDAIAGTVLAIAMFGISPYIYQLFLRFSIQP